MIPWSQDYLCEPCQGVFGEIVDKADRDKEQPCPKCGAPAKPTFSVPTLLKASFPDGTRREGFREAVEASHLEAESFELPPEQRGAHEKEIAELRSVGVSKRKRIGS